MSDASVPLNEPWFPQQLGRVLRDARVVIGWSQAELAGRAATSQSTISRIESGSVSSIEVGVVVRVLGALGIRGRLALDAPHLRDRRRQRDPVHARLVAYAARRLERSGWRVETEVPIGHDVPKGWIDLLAYRPTDRALLITELKGDLPDVGALQRQVAFYARAAASVAGPLGWRFERLAIAVLALDSDAIAERIVANRQLISRAFPGLVTHLDAWIRSADARPPDGPTLAFVDPASRRARWMMRTTAGRRRGATYASYADAATRLQARR